MTALALILFPGALIVAGFAIGGTVLPALPKIRAALAGRGGSDA